MSAERVNLDIIDEQGLRRGVLVIALLPSDRSVRPAPILDLRGETLRDTSQEPIQLLESHEYRYTVEQIEAEGEVTTDLDEVFLPDARDGYSGRLRTGLYTGVLRARFFVKGKLLGDVTFEVRSIKLDYLSQYHWMLRDIAEEFTEVLLQSFSPAQQSFRLDETRDAPTLYQRFAFLGSILKGEVFQAAMGRILSSPHREWIQTPQTRRPGQGLPAGSQAIRQLTKPGARQPWPGGLVNSLPERVTSQRTEETLDTVPNQFVKYILQEWRDLVGGLLNVLRGQPTSSPQKRGMAEAVVMMEQLDEILAQPLFAQVGSLRQYPVGNQVLQKRQGYREVLLTYIQTQLAARLAWPGGEAVYGAGQRNVAALYEFWVFIQLAMIISKMTERRFSLLDLIEEGKTGLGISLRQGEQRVIFGEVQRLGRTLALELWYNRTFSGDEASWTVAMRPDYSLKVRVVSREGYELEPTWIHFDAKYRVENVADLFQGTFEDEAEDSRRVRRADLLKMHAYRDAIQRSSGAYVIYPGTQSTTKCQYHEILPGLGAFPLRPQQSAGSDGEGTIERFICDVLTHVATQASQHERERFWLQEVRRSGSGPISLVAPFLTRPPRDTRVLLGIVRSSKDWEALWQTGKYRVPLVAGSGRLEFGKIDLLLLTDPRGEGLIWRVLEDAEVGWGNPMVEQSDQMYIGYSVEPLNYGSPLTAAAVRRVRDQCAWGQGSEYAICSWADVLHGLDTRQYTTDSRYGLDLVAEDRFGEGRLGG